MCATAASADEGQTRRNDYISQAAPTSLPNRVREGDKRDHRSTSNVWRLLVFYNSPQVCLNFSISSFIESNKCDNSGFNYFKTSADRVDDVHPWLINVCSLGGYSYVFIRLSFIYALKRPWFFRTVLWRRNSTPLWGHSPRFHKLVTTLDLACEYMLA